jgi:NTP pyrophosphatase (non-canonical NTP hydrolase)
MTEIEAKNLINLELEKAKAKHDFPTDIFKQLAIMQEEAGEVAKAVNDYHYLGQDIDNVKTELAQTAGMCIRMLINLPTL